MVGRRLSQGFARRACKMAGLLLLLQSAGCLPAPPPPAFPGVVSESSAEAQSLLTCDSIARERAAIAASRERAGQSVLAERDAALAGLEKSKGCTPPY
jgi:hypothetical protein